MFYKLKKKFLAAKFGVQDRQRLVSRVILYKVKIEERERERYHLIDLTSSYLRWIGRLWSKYTFERLSKWFSFCSISKCRIWKWNSTISSTTSVNKREIQQNSHPFTCRGQSSTDAESNYLRIACTLDMYGIELHKTSVKVNIDLFVQFDDFDYP